MEIVFFTGTHRCRAPEETRRLVTPLLRDFGITRVADVTGLDVLGIPVVQAVRPLATTLSVSQGKGADFPAAAVSAVMEAIELWHAEHAVPAPILTGPAGALDPGYDVGSIERQPGALTTDHTVIEWIAARYAITGGSAIVPRDLVHVGRRGRGTWRPHLLTASSSGLASGNTMDEATAHALYEVMERDAMAALAKAPPAQRRLVDLDTVPAGWCRDLIDGLRRAGVWLEVTAAPSRFGVPCFAAYLMVEDAGGVLAGGNGAHCDPLIALSRAVTEAAQSRLAGIAGTRDDLNPLIYQDAYAPGDLPAPAGRKASWADLTRGTGWSCRTDEAAVDEAARRITAVTGAEPMIVELADRPEFAVVKVICPGLAFHAHTERPEAEAA